jgi:predicted nucleotidyltransferase
VNDGFQVSELVRALRSGPPLRLAVLFGSAARGALRPESDVDIGVIPIDPELPLSDELALERRLEEACGRQVDVVRLDRASTFLLGEVARDGQPLLEITDGEFARFRARALGEWLDFAPAFERTAERFRQRLIELAPRPA